jgi:hypothetical protein
MARCLTVVPLKLGEPESVFKLWDAVKITYWFRFAATSWFDLTFLFSPCLQILCIALVTEMIFKCGEGKIRRSKSVSYFHGVPMHGTLIYGEK